MAWVCSPPHHRPAPMLPRPPRPPPASRPPARRRGHPRPLDGSWSPGSPPPRRSGRGDGSGRRPSRPGPGPPARPRRGLLGPQRALEDARTSQASPPGRSLGRQGAAHPGLKARWAANCRNSPAASTLQPGRRQCRHRRSRALPAPAVHRRRRRRSHPQPHRLLDGSTWTTARACPAAPNPPGHAPRPRPDAANGAVVVAELLQVRGFSPQPVARLTPMWPPCPPAPPPRRTAARRRWRPPPHHRRRRRSAIVVQGRDDFRARPPSPDSARPHPPLRHQPALPRHRPRARYGVAMVRMEVLLERSQNWPTIVWQKLL